MALKLADIPGSPLEALMALANEAPSSPQQADLPVARSEPSGRRKRRQDLGSLLVEKYLQHYGVEYTVKAGDGKMIYQLRHCLFDPTHTKNESSIIQDISGKITYHCFHNSCKDRAWTEARRHISGDDKLSEFCEGYTENWERSAGTRKEAATGILANIKIEPIRSLNRSIDLSLPPPGEINPEEFFQLANRTRKFISYRMAVYYVLHFKDLVHTAGMFWRYDGGVWRQISEYELHDVCVHALGDLIQPAYIPGTVAITRGLVNFEEPRWPKYPQYVNCLDGMIDISTSKLVDHDPKFGSRTQVPCHFNPDASAERWLKFLEEIFPGEEGKEKIDVLQKYFGYCLLTDCRYEKALFMHGEGANGKGTVLHVLRYMLGPENTSSLTMKDLGDPKFSVYFLQGKLVNVATETSARDPLATEMFKTIVSGEPITCEMKFGHKFQFNPYVKFIIAFNETPVIPDKTYGFERRILVLAFNERFEGVRRDVGLKDKLLQELDGIFYWALCGLGRLMADNDFMVGEIIQKEQAAFMADLNPTIDFLENTVGPDDDQVEVMALYHTYQRWARDNGVRQLSLKRFNREVMRYFPSVVKAPYGESRRIHWIGLTAKTELFYKALPKKRDTEDDEQ